MEILLVILVTAIILLSLVNIAYKHSGYPSLLDLIKELFVQYIINIFGLFKYKGYGAILFYSHDNKRYEMRILLLGKGERAEAHNKSLIGLYKDFKQAVNDYILAKSYEQTQTQELI